MSLTANINISGFNKSFIYDDEFPLTANDLKIWILKKVFPQFWTLLVKDFYVLTETCIKHENDFITGGGHNYYLLPRLVGGKGGFGSMLRAIGAQIEKTTNREACRDLSGRRMRDINNEKQLKDWMAKQKDRDKERARRREEKAARRRAEPLHKFEDKVYHEQKEKVSKDLDEALQQGLKRVQASATTSSDLASSSKKRKMGNSLEKQWNWIGVADDDDDDSISSNNDTDDDDVTGGACACPGLANSNAEDCEASTSSNDKFSSLLSTVNSNSEKPKTETKLNAEIPRPPEPDALPVKSERPLSPNNEQSSNPKSENEQDVTVVLENAVCAKDLECLGLEKLKLELNCKGLKCGGTLMERAQRLFAVRGLTLDQIDPSFFAKPSKGKGISKK